MKKDRLSLALERHPDDDLLLAMLLRHLPGGRWTKRVSR
jgi:hypothetical protein